MKKIFSLMIVLLITLAGCSATDQNVQATEAEDAIPVAISSASKKIIQDTYLGIGKIEAGTVLDIYTGGAGEVKDIYVTVGQQIKAGQKLFDLDKGNLDNNYATTESQLRTRRDNLKLQVSDSQISLDKKKALFASGALSQAELDAAVSQLDNLKTQYNDSVTAYNNQVGTLKDALTDRSVTSPISGRVASVTIQKSDTVQNKVALQIIDDAIMNVKAEVSGSLLDTLSVGGRVNVYPDGDRSVNLNALIMSMSYTADPKTGLYDIAAVIEDRDAQLRNGAYAELEFLINERDAILIPKKALIKRGESQIVFVTAGDKAVEREVSVGLSVDEWVEIFQGIEKEDQIIVEGQRYVKDGSVIKIAE
jgi:RND family efflux transporter MFP subunit